MRREKLGSQPKIREFKGVPLDFYDGKTVVVNIGGDWQLVVVKKVTINGEKINIETPAGGSIMDIKEIREVVDYAKGETFHDDGKMYQIQEIHVNKKGQVEYDLKETTTGELIEAVPADILRSWRKNLELGERLSSLETEITTVSSSKKVELKEKWATYKKDISAILINDIPDPEDDISTAELKRISAEIKKKHEDAERLIKELDEAVKKELAKPAPAAEAFPDWTAQKRTAVEIEAERKQHEGGVDKAKKQLERLQKEVEKKIAKKQKDKLAEIKQKKQEFEKSKKVFESLKVSCEKQEKSLETQDEDLSRKNTQLNGVKAKMKKAAALKTTNIADLAALRKAGGNIGNEERKLQNELDKIDHELTDRQVEIDQYNSDITALTKKRNATETSLLAAKLDLRNKETKFEADEKDYLSAASACKSGSTGCTELEDEVVGEIKENVKREVYEDYYKSTPATIRNGVDAARNRVGYLPDEGWEESVTEVLHAQTQSFEVKPEKFTKGEKVLDFDKEVAGLSARYDEILKEIPKKDDGVTPLDKYKSLFKNVEDDKETLEYFAQDYSSLDDARAVDPSITDELKLLDTRKIGLGQDLDQILKYEKKIAEMLSDEKIKAIDKEVVEHGKNLPGRETRELENTIEVVNLPMSLLREVVLENRENFDNFRSAALSIYEGCLGDKVSADSVEKLKQIFDRQAPDKAVMDKLRAHGIKNWASFRKAWTENYAAKVAEVMHLAARDRVLCEFAKGKDEKYLDAVKDNAKKAWAMKGQIIKRSLTTAVLVGGGAMAGTALGTALLPAAVLYGVGAGTVAGGAVGGWIRGKLFQRFLGRSEDVNEAKLQALAKEKQSDFLSKYLDKMFGDDDIFNHSTVVKKDYKVVLDKNKFPEFAEGYGNFMAVLGQATAEVSAAGVHARADGTKLTGEASVIYEQILTRLETQDVSSKERAELSTLLSKLNANGQKLTEEMEKALSPATADWLDLAISSYSGKKGAGWSAVSGAAMATMFAAARTDIWTSTLASGAIGGVYGAASGYRKGEEWYFKEVRPEAEKRLQSRIDLLNDVIANPDLADRATQSRLGAANESDARKIVYDALVYVKRIAALQADKNDTRAVEDLTAVVVVVEERGKKTQRIDTGKILELKKTISEIEDLGFGMESKGDLADISKVAARLEKMGDDMAARVGKEKPFLGSIINRRNTWRALGALAGLGQGALVGMALGSAARGIYDSSAPGVRQYYRDTESAVFGGAGYGTSDNEIAQSSQVSYGQNELETSKDVPVANPVNIGEAKQWSPEKLGEWLRNKYGFDTVVEKKEGLTSPIFRALEHNPEILQKRVGDVRGLQSILNGHKSGTDWSHDELARAARLIQLKDLPDGFVKKAGVLAIVPDSDGRFHTSMLDNSDIKKNLYGGYETLVGDAELKGKNPARLVVGELSKFIEGDIKLREKLSSQILGAKEMGKIVQNAEFIKVLDLNKVTFQDLVDNKHAGQLAKLLTDGKIGRQTVEEYAKYVELARARAKILDYAMTRDVLHDYIAKLQAKGASEAELRPLQSVCDKADKWLQERDHALHGIHDKRGMLIGDPENPNVKPSINDPLLQVLRVPKSGVFSGLENKLNLDPEKFLETLRAGTKTKQHLVGFGGAIPEGTALSREDLLKVADGYSPGTGQVPSGSEVSSGLNIHSRNDVNLISAVSRPDSPRVVKGGKEVDGIPTAVGLVDAKVVVNHPINFVGEPTTLGLEDPKIHSFSRGVDIFVKTQIPENLRNKVDLAFYNLFDKKFTEVKSIDVQIGGHVQNTHKFVEELKGALYKGGFVNNKFVDFMKDYDQTNILQRKEMRDYITGSLPDEKMRQAAEVYFSPAGDGGVVGEDGIDAVKFVDPTTHIEYFARLGDNYTVFKTDAGGIQAFDPSSPGSNHLFDVIFDPKKPNPISLRLAKE